jgi:hypothetical protein
MCSKKKKVFINSFKDWETASVFVLKTFEVEMEEGHAP